MSSARRPVETLQHLLVSFALSSVSLPQAQEPQTVATMDNYLKEREKKTGIDTTGAPLRTAAASEVDQGFMQSCYSGTWKQRHLGCRGCRRGDKQSRNGPQLVRKSQAIRCLGRTSGRDSPVGG